MALRPLDNALPIITPPERPKKQVRVAVLPQKQTNCRVNDENRIALAPPDSDASLDYISSENLKQIPDPDTEIQGLVEGLESKDWLKVCESLNKARRFALYHSDLLFPLSEKVMSVLVKAMKNPRSALCKTAIMASSDMYKAYGDKLIDPECTASDAFNQTMLQLLLKASQDKKFVCEEADRALKEMVESTSPVPLLCKLRAYVRHGNLRVRAKAAVSISYCVSRMELEEMKEFGLIPLIQMGSDLLNDKLPEAREAARNIVTSMYNTLVKNEEDEETWRSFCQSNLQAIHEQAVLKVVSTSS